MKVCLYCQKSFEPKKPKAIYCSDKCRTYANRKARALTPSKVKWVIGTDGIQRKLNRSVLLSLLEQTDGIAPKKSFVAKEAQVNDFVGQKADLDKQDELSLLPSTEKIDYHTLFEESLSAEVTKKLWEQMKQDPNVSIAEKTSFKTTYNLK